MIIKLQQGGGLPPFADFQPLNLPYTDPFQTTEASTTPSGSKSGGDDLGIKDIISLLKDVKGLPNDAAFITQQINSLMNRASFMPLKSTDIATAYSQIFLSIQNALHHKSEYDNAYKKAESKDALSEIAITSNGRLAVLDTESKNITTASLEELKQSDNYQILTNSDLLNMNSHNSGYTFDMSLLDIVENGIGMTEVNKYIQTAISSLGTSERVQEGYSVRDQQDIIAGLNVLKDQKQGMPLAGLYKNKLISKTQAQQANKALQYIYASLPNNAKTLLKYKTGSVEGSLNLIQSYIQAKQDQYQSFETTLELDALGNKPGSRSDKESELPDLTEVEKWLYGYGYKEQFNLVGGTENAIRFEATVLPMTDHSGNPVGQTTLQKALKGSFNGILDTRSITMGNQVLNINALDKVILQDGRIYKVELPLNQELLRQNIIAPDYNYSKNKENADNEIKELGITDKQEINKIYEKHNLPIKYDASGKLITTHYATFGAIHAAALDSAFKVADKSDLAMSSYLNQISDEDGANLILQNYRQINGLPANDQSLKDWDYRDKSIFEGSYDAIYEGIIYIPVQAHFANAKVGQALSPSEMETLNRMQLTSDKTKQLKKTGWNDRE